MSSLFSRLALSALFLLVANPHSFAATPIPRQTPPTLAKALAALPNDALSEGIVLMSVGAEQVIDTEAWQRRSAQYQLTPQSAPVRYDDSRLDSLAIHYKRILRTFGNVVALAPSTMVVLNSNPSPLEMSSETLPLDQSLIVLMGMLTPDQISLLGKEGLGWADLTDDQKTFVQTCVARPLEIVPSTTAMQRSYNAVAIADYKKQIKQLEPDVFGSTMRLHAHLTASYDFTLTKMNLGVDVSQAESEMPDAIPYKLALFPRSLDNAVNTPWRAEIPNAPKPSDLDVTDSSFAVIVPIADVKTVDDLVTRIAKLTKKELYCDPHYAQRTITWLGNTAASENAAEDLLRALACCLTATWRQVGDAYVLTDDKLGVGTRRHLIGEMVENFNTKLSKMIDDSAKNLQTQHWYDIVPFASDDPTALPSDLVDKIVSHKDYTNYQGQLLFGSLPASVQTELRSRLKHAAISHASDDYYYPLPGSVTEGMPLGYAKVLGSEAFPQIMDALNPNFDVTVLLHCRASLDVPNVGQIALDMGPGQTMLEMPYTRNESPPSAPKVTPNAAKVAVTMPNRGIVAVLKSASEARTFVDKMSDLELNTLYCDVFFEGETYFRNSIIPPSDPANELVLGAAIEEGRQRGVAVYAMIDTLRWSGCHPHAHLPLNMPDDVAVTLETASESFERQNPISNDPMTTYAMMRYAGGWVSPGEPQVQETLVKLVDALARTPGLAGLVFAETTGPGYTKLASMGSQQPNELGYTLSLRSEFLRAQHTDPVDISRESTLSIRANGMYRTQKDINLSLPCFDDYRSNSSLEPQWKTMRESSDAALMARLFTQARASAPMLPLVMQERSMGLTFDPWTDPKNLNTMSGQNMDPAVQPGSSFVIPFAIFGKQFPISAVGMFLKEVGPQFFHGQKNVGFFFDLRSLTLANNPESNLDTLAQFIQWTPVLK